MDDRQHMFDLGCKRRRHWARMLVEAVAYVLLLLQDGRLRRAARIPTHLTWQEKYTVYRIARQQSLDAVEVGSYLGASAAFIAAGLLDREVPAKLHCVDTWKNDAMSEGHRDTFREFLHNTQEVVSVIIPQRGDSSMVATSFDRSIGFLFIDGDHSYAGAREDVDAWLGRLEPGGAILLHDIGWATGVRRVVEEDVLPRCSRTLCLPNLFCGWLRDEPETAISSVVNHNPNDELNSGANDS